MAIMAKKWKKRSSVDTEITDLQQQVSNNYYTFW